MDSVVDGGGVVTRVSAWISHMLDKHLVDGPARAPGAAATFGGALLRRSQAGLLQNYALTMIAGVFVLLTTYLMLTFAIPTVFP